MHLAWLPNALSISRIFLMIAALAAAWFGEARGFLILLGGALVTDFLDGLLARRLHVESELGAQLDSWGDAWVYAGVPLALWWLWPDIVRREWLWVALATTAVVIGPLASWLKFQRMPSYHSWSSKFAAVLMTFALFGLFVFDLPWLFHLAAVIQFIAGLEHLTITLRLSEPQINVPTFWHARKRPPSP